MAELYPTGEQRIFYRASSKEDLTVTAKILDPDLEIANHHEFNKVPGTLRIYSAIVNFYTEGIWIAIFYEDDEEITTQAYNTKKIPTTSEGGSGFRSFLGDNVIGY